MSSESEAQIQFQILSSWGSHPRVRIARVNTGTGYPPQSKRLVKFGVPGTADIVGLVAPTGRLIMIEVKSAIGKQREAQATMQRVIESMGGAYCIARSLADVDAFMAGLGVTR